MLTYELKRADLTPEGQFSGLASVFNTLDRGGDVVMPGAFRRTIDRLGLSGSKLPLLWNHKSDLPIGWLSSLAEKSDGLQVNGQLLLDVPEGKTAYSLMKGGAGYMSIGYRLIDHESRADGARLIKDLDLVEVSAVTTPMHPDATVSQVKSDFLSSPVGLERALRDALGLSNRESKRLCRGGYDLLVGKDDSDEILAGLRLFNLILKGE